MTVHDLPRFNLVPVHVSAVIVNSADPVMVTVSTRLADLPELAKVNVCDVVCPVATCP
jgi:hypothetical protein